MATTVLIATVSEASAGIKTIHSSVQMCSMKCHVVVKEMYLQSSDWNIWQNKNCNKKREQEWEEESSECSFDWIRIENFGGIFYASI